MADTTHYAAIHVGKFQGGGVRGVQIHCQRENKNLANKDIDWSKTHLNYDLHNPNGPVNYNHKIKDIIQEGYTGKTKIRHDAVRLTGTIVTSDQRFFNKLDTEQQKKYFKESYEFLKKAYGEKNIVAAIVHMDEKSPHMHVMAVPLKDGRLSAKKFFDRKSLCWLQDKLPAHLKEQGFEIERGIPSDKKHLDTQEYKKRYNRDVEELRKERNTLKTRIKGLSDRVEGLEGVKADLDRIDQIWSKKGLMGKVSIQRNDFEQLKKLARQGVILEHRVQELEKKLEMSQRPSRMKKDLQHTGKELGLGRNITQTLGKSLVKTLNNEDWDRDR